MSYYFNRELLGISFDDAVEKVTEELKKEGFGVITEIDVKATLKTKIDVNFRNYKILGACNPHFAYNALLSEDKIGVFLPCNFVIQEKEEGIIEVLTIDPVETMSVVENEDLKCISSDIRTKLKAVLEKL